MLLRRLDQYPRHAPSLYLLGISLLLQGRLDEAAIMIDAAYRMKTWLRDLRREVVDLRPALETALKQRPDWLWARYELEKHSFLGVGLTFEHVVAHSLAHEDVFFVEIGANDGRRGDKVLPNAQKYGWKGLLAEPQPRAFEQLRKTYAGNPHVILANVAVSETDGTMSLWFDPEGRSTLASFLPERNLLSRAKHLEKVDVEAVTFDTLLERHNVTTVDVLQIDTEGYDYRILKGFDFGRFRPKLINMEFFCLPISERVATFELLRNAGYAWRSHHMDLIAVDRKVFEQDLLITERT